MKLWPARTKVQPSTEPVTDLDVMLSEPVPFKFKGKIHKLKPMSMEEFLKFTNAQNKLLGALNDTETKLSIDELAQGYFSVISAVCDTITLEDIKSMSQVQIAALYQLVIDLVTGQVDFGDGKKKRKKISIYESVAPSSSQSAASSSGGPVTKP